MKCKDQSHAPFYVVIGTGIDWIKQKTYTDHKCEKCKATWRIYGASVPLPGDGQTPNSSGNGNKP